MAQEFLLQFSFNTIVDVSRRELKALRQRIDESVSSFIFCWRGKIAEIIDRPSEEGLATNGFEESATQDFKTRGRGTIRRFWFVGFGFVRCQGRHLERIVD